MTWTLFVMAIGAAAYGGFRLFISAADEASRERVRLSDGNISREIGPC